MSRTSADHKSNQANPQSPVWQKSNDNTSNQRNPNNSAYWQSRQLPTPTNKKQINAKVAVSLSP